MGDVCSSILIVFFICSPHMAPKQKKKNQSFSSKEAAIPWPDLPRQPRRDLFINISWGGISKSWIAVPRQCSSVAKAPWLQLSKTNVETVKQKCYINSPWPEIPYYPGFYIWRGRRHLKIFQIYSYRRWYVASCWDSKIPFKFAILSSSYTNHQEDSSIMVLTGISSPSFLIRRLGNGATRTWIEPDCTVADPNSSNGTQPMIFTNAIGLKGKFYALSLQGTLALIEEVDSNHFRITHLAKNRAVPSVSSRHFVEFLTESNGEILLIFLVSRKSTNKIDNVEVFQLDLSRLFWVKMETIGDRTLFLGTNCCISVIASQAGSKSNHVYFTHHATDCWKVYDMGNGSISLG